MKRLLRAFVTTKYATAIAAQRNHEKLRALYGDDPLCVHGASLHAKIAWLKADMWKIILGR